MADKPQTRSQYRNKQSGGSKKKSQKRGKRVVANIFKTIFFVGLFLAFFGIAAGATVFYDYAKDAPKLTDSSYEIHFHLSYLIKMEKFSQKLEPNGGNILNTKIYLKH